MKMRYFLCFVLIALSLQLTGQRVKFTNVPVEFNEQLDALFLNLRNDNTQKEVDQFKRNVASGVINQSQVDQLSALFNKMLSKKLKYTPHIDAFVRSYNTYWVTTGDSLAYENWFKVCEEIVEETKIGRSLSYKNFIDFSEDLFSSWKLLEAGGRVWQIDSTGYSFKKTGEVIEVSFDTTDFVASTKKDTIAIKETAGTYYPLDFKWLGKGGKVDWKKAGTAYNFIYAELSDYEIDMNSPGYKTKNVLFYNEEFFEAPIKGDLEDRLSAPVNGEFKYPKFDSYVKDHTVEGVTDNVNIKGGYGQHGSKSVVTGTIQDKAHIQFYSHKGDVVLNAWSPFIALKKERVLMPSRLRCLYTLPKILFTTPD